MARNKGQNSAAAKALAEFERRRALGELVIVFPLRGKWLVGLSADVETQATRAFDLSQRSAQDIADRSARSRLRKHSPAILGAGARAEVRGVDCVYSKPILTFTDEAANDRVSERAELPTGQRKR